MKIFFKLIYFFHKKSIDYFHAYKRKELLFLYGDRVVIHPKASFDTFPVVEIDRSLSSICIAQGVLFRGTSRLLSFENGSIVIGKKTFFNYGCSINCMNTVDIGTHCLFGENVKIYDHNHKFSEKGKDIREQGYSTAPVKIGNNTWIGANCVILKGATIGNNCVIGANCVVSQNIPDNCIVTASRELTIAPIRQNIQAHSNL